MSQLLDRIAAVPPALDRCVTALTQDSREVIPGSCFLALAGASAHGGHYANKAIAQGAGAIISDRNISIDGEIPCIEVPDLRHHLGLLAARFYDHPAEVLEVFAVTGTNGKTTVAYLFAQAATDIGAGCGYIGTLGAGSPLALCPTGMTTPDVISLNRWLAQFRDAGWSAASLEASSHALAQDRLAGIRLRAAVFTNLGHDHLDYHGTIEAYGEAKRRLFEQPDLHAAIINIDDALGRDIAASLRDHVDLWRLSSSARAARLSAEAIELKPSGTDFVVRMDGASRPVRSKLTGRFNVDNLLSVAAMLMVRGCSFDETCNALEQLQPVPGRMQDCGINGRGARVIVDYAHSPDSIEAVLASLRELRPRRLIVMFGCGGGRDRSKRPLMGRIAERGADLVIITSDNPRDEDPADIAHEIVAGMEHAPFAVIEDRRAAIGTAIELADSGDIVLVAGKGHETYQERRGQRFAFSDQHAIREAIAGGVS